MNLSVPPGFHSEEQMKSLSRLIFFFLKRHTRKLKCDSNVIKHDCEISLHSGEMPEAEANENQNKSALTTYKLLLLSTE